MRYLEKKISNKFYVKMYRNTDKNFMIIIYVLRRNNYGEVFRYGTDTKCG